MKLITKKEVDELRKTFKELGLFAFDPGRGLHVPHDTFLFNHNGEEISLMIRSEDAAYPYEWSYVKEDGLRVDAIGTKETAKENGFPLPEETPQCLAHTQKEDEDAI